MVKTEYKIKETFISLLDKYDLDDIDVQKICSTLKIQRQTFYYHFKNIYDLIFSIYCDKRINKPLDNNLNSIIYNIFDFLYLNQSFNILIAKSNASDVLLDFISSYISLYLFKILDRYNLGLNDKKEINKFFCNAISVQILYFFSINEYSIKEGCNKMQYFFNDDILKLVIRKYQNNL